MIRRFVYWWLRNHPNEPQSNRERAAEANRRAFERGQIIPPGRTYHLGGYDDA